MRQTRKYDHLIHAVQLEDGPASTCFNDLSLVHNCLPDICSNEISLATEVAGIRIPHPVIFNAITGGAANVAAVNGQLAEVAQATGSAMAVGSQYAALEDPSMVHTYSIVRDRNPNGIIFANLGAHVKPEQAASAVDMLCAQALQLHLNPAQEIVMAEGDRDFSGYLKNIEAIVKGIDVPVIVKEVGCGIAAEQAKQLVEVGVRAIDIGGSGGTNFQAIEAARLGIALPQELLRWGIPTAISALEVAEVLPASVSLIVSGGVRSPLDAVKSLSIGAAGIALASPLIKLIFEQGTDMLVDWLKTFVREMKTYLLLTGASTICDLQQNPVVVTGYTREWLTARGIDTSKYAKRQKHG